MGILTPDFPALNDAGTSRLSPVFPTNEPEEVYGGGAIMMIHAKCYLMRISSAVVLMILCGMPPLASLAQKADQELPLVIAGKIPFYPIMARAARIQGVVKIRVVTDGEKVTSADVESGPPMLARFAKENVLTWEFSKHKPTTFVATFEYEIEGPNQCTYSNGSSTLNLPLEVRIIAKGVETCDPAAEIKSAGGPGLDDLFRPQ